MQHSTSHGRHQYHTYQQDVISCNDLFSKFNISNDVETFAKNVRPSYESEDIAVIKHLHEIFKVLSYIAGGNDQTLTDPQKEKLQESGFFMKLVDKLLDLIYSAVEKKHCYYQRRDEHYKTFGQKATETLRNWTCYGAARNRSASFLQSLENERKEISEMPLEQL